MKQRLCTIFEDPTCSTDNTVGAPDDFSIEAVKNRTVETIFVTFGILLACLILIVLIFRQI